MTLTETSKTSIPLTSPYWREVGGMVVFGYFRLCHVSDFLLYRVILLYIHTHIHTRARAHIGYNRQMYFILHSQYFDF